MIRILCVAALLVVVGAHSHDSLKHNMKRFFESLNHDIEVALRKSVRVFSEAPFSSTIPASSTTPGPTSGYASTSSSVYQPTSVATPDCDPSKSTTEFSSGQHPVRVGSIRGIPGVNFPDYKDIPLTSFSCSDKDYIPGFYADMETGCQVFHVCWPHRRESFLCPLGTIFNQALLACDYWYSSNCSLASIYYNVNSYSAKKDSKKEMGSMANILATGELTHSFEKSIDLSTASSLNPDTVLSFISQFLPVKAKVTVYPETEDARSKIVATASVGNVKYLNTHGKKTRGKPSSAKKMHYTSTTTAPETRSTTKELKISTQDYSEVEQAVKFILNEVLQTVQNVIRDLPRYLDSQKPTTQLHKHLPLTKLNPKFIVKPATMYENEMSSSASPTLENFRTSTESSSSEIPEESVKERILRHPELSVSPITKTALTTNYLRLLKIRKA